MHVEVEAEAVSGKMAVHLRFPTGYGLEHLQRCEAARKKIPDAARVRSSPRRQQPPPQQQQQQLPPQQQPMRNANYHMAQQHRPMSARPMSARMNHTMASPRERPGSARLPPPPEHEPLAIGMDVRRLVPSSTVPSPPRTRISPMMLAPTTYVRYKDRSNGSMLPSGMTTPASINYPAPAPTPLDTD